jgi:hypothetical protein
MLVAPQDRPVHQFFVSIPKNRKQEKPSQRFVEIFGTPFNQSVADLKAMYLETTLDKFLAHELRHSVGSYVILDRSAERCRIITSVGYSGGYFRELSETTVVGTLLRDVIQADMSSLRIDAPTFFYMFSYVPNSSFNSLPITTPFKDVSSLGAASVLDIGTDSKTSHRTYLVIDNLDRPTSLKQAVLEVAGAVANHCKKNAVSPALMFSGGADSLLIFLAMREIGDCGPGSLVPVTIQTSKHESLTNGHYRAIPVARSLDIDLRLVTGDWESWSSVKEQILHEMQFEFINSRRPDLALSGQEGLSEIVLHGQNFDSISGNNMITLDAAQERPLFSREQLALGSKDQALAKQYDAFTKNFQFSRDYLENPWLQKEMSSLLGAIVPMSELDPDVGDRAGIIRGLIATQRPNLLHAPRAPFSYFDQIAFFNREAGRLTDYLGQAADMCGLADLVRFYGYGQIAAKRGTSLPLQNGSQVYFFANSGPMVSYFLGRQRSIADVRSPKMEIYELIRDLSGSSYSALRDRFREGSADQVKSIESGRPKDNVDALLVDSASRLKPLNSVIYDLFEEPRERELAKKLYGEVVDGMDPGSASFLVINQSHARRLLNWELMISDGKLSREIVTAERRVSILSRFLRSGR